MRLIDADKVNKTIDRFIGYLDEDMILRIKTKISAIPTVEERPHGEWLISPDKTRACCPFCHNKWTDAKEIALLDTAFRAKNFCEYCGADMRKEGEKNENKQR